MHSPTARDDWDRRTRFKSSTSLLNTTQRIRHRKRRGGKLEANCEGRKKRGEDVRGSVPKKGAMPCTWAPTEKKEAWSREMAIPPKEGGKRVKYLQRCKEITRREPTSTRLTW